ncbi:hypothetical protein QQF64_023081 [Cirrhinus molitorella]|uniref:Uncharacterized protein n=1 Tax=Cirrhinus molitorella TaxID=172907 RepID=A0ABR3L5P6_9TELE
MLDGIAPPISIQTAPHLAARPLWSRRLMTGLLKKLLTAQLIQNEPERRNGTINRSGADGCLSVLPAVALIL